jgi:hypothetical protein
MFIYFTNDTLRLSGYNLGFHKVVLAFEVNA